jgi:D-serine deaminase-like pyridoxal phosphate-dependent protein
VTQHRFDAAVERHRLASRLSHAIDALPEQPATPTVVVDLDAFDLNADDLARRAAGKPIRVATKSLRVPALIARALAHEGFAGVLAYSLREALWLAENDVSDDVLMGYPSVDRPALTRLAAHGDLAARVTLMVDSTDHLDLVDAVRPAGGPPVRVAIDVDAGLRIGRAHVGPRRSPLLEPGQVRALADEVLARPGFALTGVMTYEGQVAGVPDDTPGHAARSAAVRRMKQASVTQLTRHRAAVAATLREVCDVPLWNAGGSGSLETSAADPAVTEVTAGSGLLVPHLFDHYRSFEARPAAYFGLRVVRRPAPDVVTVAGGGLIASGPPGRERAPLPWAPPGLELTALEGAGEVQTPLQGPGAGLLEIGDLVWFRHAKSGELAEHTCSVHLLAGTRIRESVPTYRGLGHAW